MLSVPGSQVLQIFAITGQPLDSREMAGIGKGLVQSPEAADKSFRILCNRLGEITTLRGNCTDNGYGTLCSVQVLHHSRALIEAYLPDMQGSLPLQASPPDVRKAHGEPRPIGMWSLP
jgi:hypothetical protein